MLFRIDIYFTKYSLAVEIDEKCHTDRDLIFEKKREKALEKKPNSGFFRIMMQTMRLIEYRPSSVTLKTKKKEMK